MKSQDKEIVNYIAEAGLLKRIARSGWWVIGIKNPESVADHSFRSAILAYCLAKSEKADAGKTVLMALFNDMHESRINDLHKMAQQYMDFEAAEKKSFNEQIKSLPKEMKGELFGLHKEYSAQKTKEAIVARDADILECLIQAKEYKSQGIKDADKFMKKPPKFLRTKSAKSLWRAAKSADLNKWWERVSDFRR